MDDLLLTADHPDNGDKRSWVILLSVPLSRLGYQKTQRTIYSKKERYESSNNP